nr:GNAT family N-acetyltransferase [Actinacidiphila yeochonensis]
MSGTNSADGTGTAQVRARFDAQVRRGAGVAGPDGVVRQSGEGEADWTAVVWSDFPEGEEGGAAADAAIAAQLAWLASPAGRGRELEWKLYSYDRPADLGARLAAAGFAAEPPETVLVAEAAEVAAAEGAAPPAGVRLERVTDAAGVELVAEVHARAFGDSADRLRERLLGQLGDPDLEITLAVAGGRPVSAARTEFSPGTDFAGLWGGGTVPEWRGRGIYRALVTHRARLALARGHRYLQVDASEQSRPVLERLGFTALATTTPYLRQG